MPHYTAGVVNDGQESVRAVKSRYAYNCRFELTVKMQLQDVNRVFTRGCVYPRACLPECLFTRGCVYPRVCLSEGVFTRGCVYPRACLQEGVFTGGMFTRGGRVHPRVCLPEGVLTQGCVYPRVCLHLSKSLRIR